MTNPLDAANPIANAVLYEGYVLYPYRSSAAKNQSRSRWQWGVLVPPSYMATETGEHASARTECLLEEGTDPVLHVRLRFLQLQGRAVEVGDDDTGFTPVESLTMGERELRSWDEVVDREIDLVVPLRELAALDGEERIVPISAPASREVEVLADDSGTRGRIVRETWPLDGLLRLSCEMLPGPYGVVRVRAVLENVSTWDGSEATRDAALRHSLIAAHIVIALRDGGFISLLEPPEWATGYVKDCVNERMWPVLVGEHGARDLVLSSPIILYDYPTIAPESPGNFFDATEMDEMLALRTLTLTDEEKREARATDDKSAEIIDRADHLPPELIERLHGAVRYLRPAKPSPSEPVSIEEITTPSAPWWDPAEDASVSPETDAVQIAGRSVAKGSKVVLQPGLRRADAQDMFLAGRVATVQAVLLDLDGEHHLAVALDEDPAADLQIAHGRFRYFAPEEVIPVDGSSASEVPG
ncbi:MAG: hypothetical protein ACRDQ5_23330 [Sciscionella sp.]